MTKLDNVLKSRNMTLLTKVCIVKALFFLPVVMHRFQIWTIKKVECKELMFQIVVLEKSLESHLGSKETKPVNSEGNLP